MRGLSFYLHWSKEVERGCGNFYLHWRRGQVVERVWEHLLIVEKGIDSGKGVRDIHFYLFWRRGQVVEGVW